MKFIIHFHDKIFSKYRASFDIILKIIEWNKWIKKKKKDYTDIGLYDVSSCEKKTDILKKS